MDYFLFHTINWNISHHQLKYFLCWTIYNYLTLPAATTSTMTCRMLPVIRKCKSLCEPAVQQGGEHQQHGVSAPATGARSGGTASTDSVTEAARERWFPCHCQTNHFIFTFKLQAVSGSMSQFNLTCLLLAALKTGLSLYGCSEKGSQTTPLENSAHAIFFAITCRTIKMCFTLWSVVSSCLVW